MTTNDNGNVDPKINNNAEDFELDEGGSSAEDKRTPEQKQQDRANETPEAKRARLQRQLDQHNKKYPVASKPNEAQPNSDNSEKGLDYGQKAFLVANGIKGSDEIKLAQEMMKNTGKSLDDVIESKFFQGELKELRDARNVENAVPPGSKRSSQASSNSVEYWIAKGTLPPRDQPELRKQVVQAKYNAEKNVNVFSSDPVIK